MSGLAVHAVLPAIVADPRRPSGGSRYDEHVCEGLARRGWEVRRCVVRARGGGACREVADLLAGLPADALVLIDGLVASPCPDALAEHAARLRLVVLLHLPAADEPGEGGAGRAAARERRALRCARAVVVPSAATRRHLLADPALAGLTVHVAPPGVERARAAVASPAGSRLLCVAAVTPRKGHDVLVDALARLDDLDWTLVCAGPDDLDRAFTGLVRSRIAAAGLGERIRMLGALDPARIAGVYEQADLLVLASRAEPYGMVVSEALARAVPVAAADVDGLPEALGQAPGGEVPGELVPPEDPGALAAALRRWLTDPRLRERRRAAALARRDTLRGWDAAASALAEVLLQAGEVA